VGLTFALFLLLTPVHAMQYTVWPIAGLYLMSVWPATVYSLVAGLLLAKVYSRWSHAYPWNWDQAWSTGMNPPERKFAAIVWLVLLVTIVVSLLPPLNRSKPEQTRASDEAVDGTVGQSASIAERAGVDGDMAESLPHAKQRDG
jgi:hypothetical protein